MRALPSRFIPSSVLLLSFISTLLPAQKAAPAKSSSTYYPATSILPHQSPMPMDEMPPMVMVAPLFIEGNRITSSLVLVNNAEVSVGASITVMDNAGKQVAHLDLTLSPHQQRLLPISQLLRTSPLHPAMGSITVIQDPKIKGMNIAGQVVITDEHASIPTYIDEELALPSMDGSTTLRAITDDSEGQALIALTNTGDASQKAILQCVGIKSEGPSLPVMVQAHSTTVLNGCSGEPLTSLEQYLIGQKSSGDHNVNGIEITGSGEPGSLSAFALAPHRRNEQLVLSGIPFTDPGLTLSPNVVFAGIPVGLQRTLPDGTYVPRISLANFSASPAHVTISLAHSTEGDTADAKIESTSNLTKTRELTILPRHSAEIVMDGSDAQSGLLHSVLVTSDLKPGELVGKLVSRSDGTLFQVELLGKDEKDQNNAGLHPWSVEGDTESHLLLFNHTNRELPFDVAIHNEAGVWDRTYKVAPFQTREVDFNRIIDWRLKDDKGHLLSPTYKSGTVNWMVPNSGNGSGRLMVTSRSRNMARNYSCGTYIAVCGLTVTGQNGGFVPLNGSSEPFFGSVQYCGVYGYGQCQGGAYIGNGSAYYSAYISPSTVIRFNSPGDSSTYAPNVFGLAPGTGSGSLYASGGGCTAGGGASPPPVVQKPTSTDNAGDKSNGPSVCPPGLAGWDRTVFKVLLDQDGKIFFPDTQWNENVTVVPGKNGFGFTNASIQQSGAVTSKGGFQDHLAFCSSLCPGSTSTTATQAQTDTYNGITYTLTPNTFLYSCQANTINGK